MMQPFDKVPGFDEAREFGQAGTEGMMKSVAAVSKTAQTLGIEWSDFAKQSYDHGVAAAQKLAQATSPQTALEIQAEFLKGSYERLVAQAKVAGELYSGLATEMTQPFAALMPKAPVA